ncbi:hypothetical protein RZS08_57175, partial [Arthrospira platensis SPKY1]|nr:hypothetical protein [Arthrospira platensis SPKY1]
MTGSVAPVRRVRAFFAYGVVVSLSLLSLAGEAVSDASIDLCFNYGCNTEVPVWFRETDLIAVRETLERATDPESEREAIASALAQ